MKPEPRSVCRRRPACPPCLSSILLLFLYSIVGPTQYWPCIAAASSSLAFFESDVVPPWIAARARITECPDGFLGRPV
jgi:hypothetical protein